jgi:hypothetical protein
MTVYAGSFYGNGASYAVIDGFSISELVAINNGRAKMTLTESSTGEITGTYSFRAQLTASGAYYNFTTGFEGYGVVTGQGSTLHLWSIVDGGLVYSEGTGTIHPNGTVTFGEHWAGAFGGITGSGTVFGKLYDPPNLTPEAGAVQFIQAMASMGGSGGAPLSGSGPVSNATDDTATTLAPSY